MDPGRFGRQQDWDNTSVICGFTPYIYGMMIKQDFF